MVFLGYAPANGVSGNYTAKIRFGGQVSRNHFPPSGRAAVGAMARGQTGAEACQLPGGVIQTLFTLFC
jgi:hypothetical protein